MLDHCRQVGKWHLLLGIRNTCAPRVRDTLPFASSLWTVNSESSPLYGSVSSIVCHRINNATPNWWLREYAQNVQNIVQNRNKKTIKYQIQCSIININLKMPLRRHTSTHVFDQLRRYISTSILILISIHFVSFVQINWRSQINHIRFSCNVSEHAQQNQWISISWDLCFVAVARTNLHQFIAFILFGDIRKYRWLACTWCCSYDARSRTPALNLLDVGAMLFLHVHFSSFIFGAFFLLLLLL